MLAQWAVATRVDDAAGVVGRHRQVEDLGEVGDPLGFEEAARVAQVGVEDVTTLIDDEILESLPPDEVLAGADGDLRGGDQAPPALGVVGGHGVFEPERLDRLDRLGELDRGPQVVLPVAVDHDVVVPADRLAAVLEALADPRQLGGREHPVGAVAARGSDRGSVCAKPNLWAVKPLGSDFTRSAHSRHEAGSIMSRGAEWSYIRTRSRNRPPSRVVVGTPRVLPARSQRAISMPLTARSSMCAEPSIRVPRPVISASIPSGSLPISSGFSARTPSLTPTPGLPYASPMP